MATEKRGSRQFYACVFYDTETNKFFVENWEDGTGRDDGDIWDNELEEWRYPNDHLVAGEEEFDKKVWSSLCEAIGKMPPVLITPTAEEEDIVY